MSKKLVFIENDQPVTTSLKVADTFDKPHKDVMKSVRKLLDEIDGGKISPVKMFDEASYVDKKGEQRPMYYMNRDGFTLLAMGFTGKKALEFKIKYIDAFNRMEEKLNEILKDRANRWIETRQHGKETRKKATEIYYNFALYAQNQGDTREIGKIISAVTIPCNLAAGLPMKNGRDEATVHQLNCLDLIEGMVAKVIDDGVADGLPYTQIEAIARQQIRSFLSVTFQSPKLLK